MATETDWRSAAAHSPGDISDMMDDQRQAYLSLAVLVAGLHHEVECVVKRRRLN